jgi:hypothetical protein
MRIGNGNMNRSTKRIQLTKTITGMKVAPLGRVSLNVCKVFFIPELSTEENIANGCIRE